MNIVSLAILFGASLVPIFGADNGSATGVPFSEWPLFQGDRGYSILHRSESSGMSSYMTTREDGARHRPECLLLAISSTNDFAHAHHRLAAIYGTAGTGIVGLEERLGFCKLLRPRYLLGVEPQDFFFTFFHLPRVPVLWHEPSVFREEPDWQGTRLLIAGAIGDGTDEGQKIRVLANVVQRKRHSDMGRRLLSESTDGLARWTAENFERIPRLASVGLSRAQRRLVLFVKLELDCADCPLRIPYFLLADSLGALPDHSLDSGVFSWRSLHLDVLVRALSVDKSNVQLWRLAVLVYGFNYDITQHRLPLTFGNEEVVTQLARFFGFYGDLRCSYEENLEKAIQRILSQRQT